MTTTVSEILPPVTPANTLSERLTHVLNHLKLPPSTLIFVFALFIGGGTGTALVLFHTLMRWIQALTLETLMGQIGAWGDWTFASIPALGGLMVGVVRWYCRNFTGEGVSTLISAYGLEPISPWRPLSKMVAASVSLSTGASLGPEGPSVEIGANIGVQFAQLFQVSRERYRLMLGAGVAAGLAAGFNAPIAGVFFALELVLGTSFATSSVSLILLSAVVAALVSRVSLGVHPAFDLPIYEIRNQWEWIFYLGLGLIAGVFSVIFTQTIKITQQYFQSEQPGWFSLSQIPSFLHPMIGGACVGIVALYIPQIFGIGYDTIEAILRDEDGSLGLQLLGLLLVLKILLSAISLGSGLVGGIFAPAMLIGATLGAIYGSILGQFMPDQLMEIASPAAYAMVGMAAVLAGSVKAPMTAILLFFELTQNYLIILPLMAAVGVSVLVVNQIQATPLVSESSSGNKGGLNLQQMGINLEKNNEYEILEKIPIASIMQSGYLSLPGSMNILEASSILLSQKCYAALVMDKTENLIGIVTLTDLKYNILQEQNLSENQAKIKTPLQEICTTEILYAYPDEPITRALERMANRGLFLLPVVGRGNSRRVMGIIEREKISLACNLAVTQEALRSYLS